MPSIAWGSFAAGFVIAYLVMWFLNRRKVVS